MRAMCIATNIFLEQGHGVIVNNISAGRLRGARARRTSCFIALFVFLEKKDLACY